MFRLAGMLFGSATVTLLLVLVLGPPSVNGLVERLGNTRPRLAELTRGARTLVADRLSGGATEPAPAAKTVAQSSSAVAEAPAPLPAEPSSPPVDSVGIPSAESVAAEPAPPRMERSSAAQEAAGLYAEPASRALESWHAVWMPFYSERSARGFADRLAQTTGLDYHVGKTASGRYQVSVAYRDDTERQAHLEEISRATGLPVESLQP